MSAADKTIKSIKRILEQHGCTLVQTKRRAHFKVYRDGKLISTLSNTPSDPRSRLNEIARLRRAGIPIPH